MAEMCIRDRSHVDRSITNPEIFVETNVLGTVNLLQCAKNAWYRDGAWAEGKKYLQVSTDEVYGALGPEGYFMETTPLCPHSPYSSSKASADMFVKAFHDTYGLSLIHILQTVAWQKKLTALMAAGPGKNPINIRRREPIPGCRVRFRFVIRPAM